MSPDWSHFPRGLALAAQAGALGFLGALLALHALTLRSVPWYLSEYANTPWRPLFMAGGYAFVLALASAAVGLRRVAPREPQVQLALALLALVVPFAFLAATFPVDPGDRPATAAGRVHDWSTVPMFLFLNASMLVLHPWLARQPATRPLARLALVTGAVAAVAEVAYLAARLHDAPAVALAQRTLVAACAVWVLGLATALRKGLVAGLPDAQGEQAGSSDGTAR